MPRINFHSFLLVCCLSAVACSDTDTIIHESSENSESYRIPKNCSQNLFCEQVGEIMLWIDGDHIAEETPFNVYLKMPTENRITLNTSIIEGVSMNMGYIPLFFKPIVKGVYKAEGMIGICETDSMLWQIRITFDRQDNQPSITLLLTK